MKHVIVSQVAFYVTCFVLIAGGVRWYQLGWSPLVFAVLVLVFVVAMEWAFPLPSQIRRRRP